MIVTTSRNTPIAPHNTSSGRLTHPRTSGRQLSCSRRGVGHSTASAKNEITSTAAAAHANSHCGIGSGGRWARPCASATAGRKSRAASVAAGTSFLTGRF